MPKQCFDCAKFVAKPFFLFLVHVFLIEVYGEVSK